ncbi:uncharacterized protein LOC134251187 [Saccostrea cucullata]|uniref:uncharacterized protein LOC134251187 n=1 Tax=Saccostrea cuccullata TaxID=36930 RepID=UPI002ECFF6F1
MCPDNISTTPAGDPLSVTNNSDCVECCQTDACNSHGCGSQDYPAIRGPLCFNCGQISDPTLCHRAVVCAPDQVCHIQENNEFGDTFYTTSCINKHECNIGSGSIFGKRSEKSVCNHCCSTDLCNNKCGDGIQISTIPI